jgi:NAD(P)-dependent dehydrogenase (short-subunit alcohol dehydrogenase family)
VDGLSTSTTTGPAHCALRTDVTVPGNLDRMVDLAMEKWGGIDVLCNNAGWPDRFLGVHECTDAEWEHGLAIHLTAPFHASRRALPHMLEAGHGRDGGRLMQLGGSLSAVHALRQD